MRGVGTHIQKIIQAKKLRSKGHTLLEISRIVDLPKTTTYKYIKEIEIASKYKKSFESKRFGSKNYSLKEWGRAKNRAEELLAPIININPVVLACLYWGEGNKTE